MPRTADAVVVGAGVVGLCAALRLAQAGLRTVVLERGAIAGGATGAATGIIPRDTGADGAFAALCRAGAVELDRTLAELADGPEPIDVGHARPGGLQLAGSQGEIAAIRGAYRAEIARGVPAEWWDGPQLHQEEPALAEGVLAAVHYPTVRRIGARAFAEALAAALRRAGGDIVAHCPVSRITPDGQAWSVEAAEPVQAGIVVAATGVWAGSGLPDIPPAPVEPVRGQAIRLRAPPGLLRRILMFGDRHIVPTTDGAVVVGATTEHVGFDDRTTAAGVGALLADAVRVVPALAGARFERAWSGLRPKSRRHLPLIGPAGPPGVYLAAGHYKSGLLLGPITARLIAAQATGATPALHGVDPAAFAP